VEIELALLICKEGKGRDRVALATKRCGLNPICCSNLQDARALLAQCEFRVVLCEDTLPDGDFQMALREVRTMSAHGPLILIAQNAVLEGYWKALAAGVFDCIVMPISVGDSERIVRCALEETGRALKQERIAA
jgi:DNA-binding NtrC family response regulator